MISINYFYKKLRWIHDPPHTNSKFKMGKVRYIRVDEFSPVAEF
ncbi:hypothetical protein FDUTEX481_07059 [Tolypothrix sp. PCC 7601]|nr:hypothetical protein FDUTEX481_07059 [Tolypothrix sp. PCC 7601]